MILDLDVGNTFVKWRIGERTGQYLTRELSRAQFLEGCGAEPPQRVRLATVACERQQALIADWCLDAWGVEVEIARTRACAAGVRNSYAKPERMGVDRWLAIIAAYNQCQGACCVVDCGSAITVDYVNGQGEHVGGYIMPGLRLLRSGLLANTERIAVAETGAQQATAEPGCCTEDAVDHGIWLMFEALAERVGRDYCKYLGRGAALVVTGGDGARFHALVENGVYRPGLVLDGLAYDMP